MVSNISSPQEFATAEEAYAAAESLKKIFPPEALVIYPNSKEGYTLVVRKPVADNNLEIQDIISKDSYTTQEQEDFNRIIKPTLTDSKNRISEIQ